MYIFQEHRIDVFTVPCEDEDDQKALHYYMNTIVAGLQVPKLSRDAYESFRSELQASLLKSKLIQLFYYLAVPPFISVRNPIKGILAEYSETAFRKRPLSRCQPPLTPPRPDIRYSLKLQELFEGEDEVYWEIIQKKGLFASTQIFDDAEASFTFFLIEAESIYGRGLGYAINRAGLGATWIIEGRRKFFDAAKALAREKKKGVVEFDESCFYLFTLVTNALCARVLSAPQERRGTVRLAPGSRLRPAEFRRSRLAARRDTAGSYASP